MNFAEAIVPNYGLLKTGIDLEILPKVYVTARANIGFYTNSQDEYIDFIKTSPFQSYLKGYCAGLRADTFIGPINILMGITITMEMCVGMLVLVIHFNLDCL